MSFQDIKPVEKASLYIDVAIRKSRTQISGIQRLDSLERDRRIKRVRMESIANYLHDVLFTIVKGFPNLDSLTDFYDELLRATLDFSTLKKSLGSVNYAATGVRSILYQYQKKIDGAKNHKDLSDHYASFLGRCFSYVKNANASLVYLEHARKVMQDFPVIKNIFTVAIAGFPNVGKTTLLSKLTGSKPEINSYAFTTRSIMSGNIKIGNVKIQVLDTPGTLNRPDKMNVIEMQAHIAMKHAADLIVFIYDLTEEYDLKEQKKLHQNVKKINSNVVCFMSKKDIVDSDKFKEFKKKHGCIDDADELKRILVEKAD